MTAYDPAEYGNTWSADYERLYGERDDPAVVIACLGRLTDGRSLLDLGIGTGRLAIPFHDAGWRVSGVEASGAMLEELQRHAEGRDIDILRGDIRTFAIDRRFDVALLAFSTLFLLPDQSSQVDCLARAVAHLADGGRLVVEAFVPDHTRWTEGKRLALSRWDADGIEIEAARHDRANQTIDVRYVRLATDEALARPLRLRYAWPAEIDLMAALAGAHRVARWADWHGTAFEATSGGHVSVYAAGPVVGAP